ncbi:MAG TPA: PIG-L family deacetylase [Ignavibacteria bacterium]|nr:PIG-L family deacetylase [Bacteroidota bacterium]HRE10567.1 PIG-L family deacetylase [Ignavibacteria bacterium]HRF64854.1 PIG-L family deacetylase [Ignavibacteria bacterium]HRJ04766.1 PIG-L family deacetylase [Ignavibacteria bacterium]HRJ85114.1 PIG-L family deacetylase [Ignavibacteria bacterium]
MKILYIFPHPDDESFGPAHAMSKQRRDGHDVYLLTLTKGGATKQRHKYGYSIEEMGEVRFKEMLDVEKALNLSGMKVLDLPDSGLKKMDPRDIEKVVYDEIERLKPDVVVTYAVHGISGFHDHLIIHGIVKRVFVEMKEKLGYPKRLAFFTITEEEAAKQTHFKISGSKPEEIDCIVEVDRVDIDNCLKALDCYVTFQETIKATNIQQHITSKVVFEIFGETLNKKLKDIFEGIQ